MKSTLYVSGYTDNQPGTGIKRMEFDGTALKESGYYGPAVNPSYILVEKKFLYAVEETEGGAAVLRYSLTDGAGERYLVPGTGLCHLVRCGNYLYASGYAGGCLTGLRAEDGQTVCYLQYEGSGADPNRQEASHVHSANPSPDGRHLFVADLGTDRLYQYDVQQNGTLMPHAAQPWTETGPGQGPRSFDLSQDENYLAVANQWSGKVSVFLRDAGSGALGRYVAQAEFPSVSCVKWKR